MGSAVLKKIKKGGGQQAINNRYKWVEFSAEDDTVYRARVRTSLLNKEVEKLVGLNMNGDQKQVHEAIHRYVEEWNITIESEEDGELYEVLPPREAGPEAFDYVPTQFVYAIIGTLINEPFTKIDPKSLTPVETTEET